MLNESQKRLIYYSWNVLSENPQSMMRFYDHLFDIAPETIHFFPDEISKQSDKLAHTMNFVIGNLSCLEDIKSTIEELGRFHNKLEIEPEHYIKLKKALVITIKENMGDRYRNEIGDAWDNTLQYLSRLMLNATTKKKRKFRTLFKLFHWFLFHITISCSLNFMF